MTEKELQLVYLALRRNCGHTLCPDWTPEQQRELTLALDSLRSELCQRLPDSTFEGLHSVNQITLP